MLTKADQRALNTPLLLTPLPPTFKILRTHVSVSGLSLKFGIILLLMGLLP